MKTKMIILGVLFALCTPFIGVAQDDALDQKVQTCLETEDQALEEPFSTVDWLARMDFYLRKTVQRVSSEHTRSIGELKKPTLMLAKLSKNCEALQGAQKPLATLVSLYESGVKITMEESLLGESMEVQTDKKTVESMKKQIDKIRKTLSIEKVYYRIDD